MKLVREEVIIDAGDFSQSVEYEILRQHIIEGIARVDWPHGSGKFSIRPGRNNNGVDPIKLPFVAYLRYQGWRTELPLGLQGNELRPGDLDAIFRTSDSYFAAEWETGNISSSHRAVNKLVLGLIRGALVGGALILPSRLLAANLTQRIGNYPELAPYFPLWKRSPVENGILTVFVVEHDELDLNAPLIPKRTDGRARG